MAKYKLSRESVTTEQFGAVGVERNAINASFVSGGSERSGLLASFTVENVDRAIHTRAYEHRAVGRKLHYAGRGEKRVRGITVGCNMAREGRQRNGQIKQYRQADR